MRDIVFLVDDDHARAMTLAMRLAATRYPVTVADTALGALRSARRCAA